MPLHSTLILQICLQKRDTESFEKRWQLYGEAFKVNSTNNSSMWIDGWSAKPPSHIEIASSPRLHLRLTRKSCRLRPKIIWRLVGRKVSQRLYINVDVVSSDDRALIQQPLSSDLIGFPKLWSPHLKKRRNIHFQPYNDIDSQKKKTYGLPALVNITLLHASAYIGAHIRSLRSCHQRLKGSAIGFSFVIMKIWIGVDVGWKNPICFGFSTGFKTSVVNAFAAVFDINVHTYRPTR